MRSLGVCYYPEHWDRSVWDSDADRMVEAGLSWVRIGEFAWSRIEPTPGNFKWEWLDDAIEVLGSRGLKIHFGDANGDASPLDDRSLSGYDRRG